MSLTSSGGCIRYRDLRRLQRGRCYVLCTEKGVVEEVAMARRKFHPHTLLVRLTKIMTPVKISGPSHAIRNEYPSIGFLSIYIL
jgi:hypothetical protein